MYMLMTCQKYHISKLHYLFADDTCRILANKNIDILEKMVDQEINRVDSLMRHNKLSLNYRKLSTWYLTQTRSRAPHRVQVGSNLINRAHSTNYLGMHLDHKLNLQLNSLHLHTAHIYELTLCKTKGGLLSQGFETQTIQKAHTWSCSSFYTYWTFKGSTAFLFQRARKQTCCLFPFLPSRRRAAFKDLLLASAPLFVFRISSCRLVWLNKSEFSVFGIITSNTYRCSTWPKTKWT